MKHEQINYKDIMDFGFTEDYQSDSVYEAQYGFPYSIITLNLTKRIYLDWDKETRLCWIYRIDKEGYIQAKRPIYNLEQLSDTVSFFLEKDKKVSPTESNDNQKLNPQNVYVRVDWPDVQEYQDQPWFIDEAVLDTDTASSYLIPIDRLNYE